MLQKQAQSFRLEFQEQLQLGQAGTRVCLRRRPKQLRLQADRCHEHDQPFHHFEYAQHPLALRPQAQTAGGRGLHLSWSQLSRLLQFQKGRRQFPSSIRHYIHYWQPQLNNRPRQRRDQRQAVLSLVVERLQQGPEQVQQHFRHGWLDQDAHPLLSGFCPALPILPVAKN